MTAESKFDDVESIMQIVLDTVRSFGRWDELDAGTKKMVQRRLRVALDHAGFSQVQAEIGKNDGSLWVFSGDPVLVGAVCDLDHQPPATCKLVRVVCQTCHAEYHVPQTEVNLYGWGPKCATCREDDTRIPPPPGELI